MNKAYRHTTMSNLGAQTPMNPGINGVFIAILKIISDERGSVLKMIDNTTKNHYFGFGIDRKVEQIYFSTVKPNVVKAWHGHKKMTLNYVCLLGKVMIGLCDLRVGSTFGNTAQIYLDAGENYNLITIPPGVWNGYRSLDEHPAMIANAASGAYSEYEISRIHPNVFPVEFDWGPYEAAG